MTDKQRGQLVETRQWARPRESWLKLKSHGKKLAWLLSSFTNKHTFMQSQNKALMLSHIEWHQTGTAQKISSDLEAANISAANESQVSIYPKRYFPTTLSPNMSERHTTRKSTSCDKASFTAERMSRFLLRLDDMSTYSLARLWSSTPRQQYWKPTGSEKITFRPQTARQNPHVIRSLYGRRDQHISRKDFAGQELEIYTCQEKSREDLLAKSSENAYLKTR